MSHPMDHQTTVITICPNLKCKKVLRVPAQFRGQVVKCHYCSINFRVPLARKDAAPSGNGGKK
jgi:hypothetical protein